MNQEQKLYLNERLSRLHELETDIEDVITDWEYRYANKNQDYFKAEEIINTLLRLKNGKQKD